MFNSNSYKFKRLNIAEKARSKFRTRPSGVRRGSVSEGPFTRYTLEFFVAHFFLIAQLMYIRLK